MKSFVPWWVHTEGKNIRDQREVSFFYGASKKAWDFRWKDLSRHQWSKVLKMSGISVGRVLRSGVSIPMFTDVLVLERFYAVSYLFFIISYSYLLRATIVLGL